MRPETARLGRARIESRLGRDLRTALDVAIARRRARAADLSPSERRVRHGLRSSRRLESWLMGRAALKSLLGRRGEGADTAGLVFPHPSISLTHAAGHAVAVGLKTGAGRVSGIGVDLELGLPPRPGSERFFLCGEEQLWARSLAPARRPAALLRLWTVKEALFKSNPENASTLLGEYRTADPRARAGAARFTGEPHPLYRYATIALARGFLTVALREATE